MLSQDLKILLVELLEPMTILVVLLFTVGFIHYFYEEKHLWVTVINTQGVDNFDRHFSFGERCKKEHLGQSTTSYEGVPDVRLLIYTSPKPKALDKNCPTGTIYITGPVNDAP